MPHEMTALDIVEKVKTKDLVNNSFRAARILNLRIIIGCIY